MTREIGGNRSKYESYREAWQRIEASRQAGFFLEAIVIEESIIADRLVSYLSRPDSPNRVSKNKKGMWPGLGDLIAALQSEFPAGLSIGNIEDVANALNDWRQGRNTAVHAIVKSDPGTPTVEVQEFLMLAEKAAERGAILARAISSWHQSVKRQSP